jgi:formate-dependent nitrite reductase membrane component NrfD
MPSSTFFTAPPDWHWLVILYFFFGGIAGGSYLIAALIDLFGRVADRPLARLGYIVAFVAAIFCPILLTADLTRAERFWHMLLQSKRLLPMFKYWSPISFGSWILLIFSLFAFVSFVGALAEGGRRRGPRWPGLLWLRRGPVGTAIAVIGGLFALAFAGYTGVLLDVTNRPIWADNQLLGLLFLASGATTAAALLALLSHWQATAAPDAEFRLARMETGTSLVELVVLVLLVLTLGQVAKVWLSAWGLLLVVGVVLAGILLPLALHWRPRLLGGLSAASASVLASVLALVGGFILRVVVILSAQAV